MTKLTIWISPTPLATLTKPVQAELERHGTLVTNLVDEAGALSLATGVLVRCSSQVIVGSAHDALKWLLARDQRVGERVHRRCVVRDEYVRHRMRRA